MHRERRVPRRLDSRRRLLRDGPLLQGPRRLWLTPLARASFEPRPGPCYGALVMHQRRTLLLPLLLLLGCSSDGGGPDPSDEPDAAVEPSPDAGQDAASIDEPTSFPEVLGVEPLEDLDPDPGVVEVEITADEADL